MAEFECEICECKTDTLTAYHLMVQPIGALTRRKSSDILIPECILPAWDITICRDCKKKLDAYLNAMRQSYELKEKKDE